MHDSFVSLATRLIAKNGRQMQLVEIVNSGDVLDPSQQEMPHDIKGVQIAFKSSDIDGNLIKLGDLQILVDSLIEPRNDMRLRDGSTDYSIVDVKSVKPGTTSIIYKIQARL